jgi:hypothetical protein
MAESGGGFYAVGGLATARIVIEEVFLRGDYSCPFLSLNYLS